MVFLFITYLLVLLLAFLLQRQLIYYPERYTAAQLTQRLGYVQLQRWPPTGNYRGLEPKKPVINAKATVLVFHGNAGSALDRGFYTEALQGLGFRVILVEYPGYGARDGSPSEQALIADGIQTAKLVAQYYNGPLILAGESLGSGVAAGVIKSGEVPVKGLLLISPFDALNRVAQHHYWFFLARWLVRDKFNNIENLRNFTGNVAVILANQDEVIPNKHTLTLFDALQTRKKLWRFGNAGHNNWPVEPWREWWREAMQFIDG